MDFYTKLETFILKLDIYGHRIDFYINSQPLVKSKFGAFFSVLIICFSLYLFANNYLAWLNNENLQTISSSQSYSVNELLNKNESFIYNFDYTNYNVYFVIMADFGNGSEPLYYDSLKRYINQTYFFTNSSLIKKNIGYQNCFVRNKNKFLLQANNPTNDYNKSTNSACINENMVLEMGLFAKPLINLLVNPVITYKITKCVNNTNENIICASDQEIIAMFKYITIQTSIPRSLYNFNDPINPRKRSYDYKFYSLDFSLVKTLTANLMPVYLYTDEGIISIDYKQNSIDFNVDSSVYETGIRGQENDILFQYDLTIGVNQQIYYRKNDKFNIIIANFGGTINILFILGRIMCYSYNLLVLKHKLINISFSNLEVKEKKMKK